MNGLAHSEWVSGNARGIEESKRRSESLAFAIMLIRQVDANDRVVRYVLPLHDTRLHHGSSDFSSSRMCKIVLILLGA